MCLYQTCSFLKGTSLQWINGQKVPYASKGSQWVGFDNQRSYDAKVHYVALSFLIFAQVALPVSLIVFPLVG